MTVIVCDAGSKPKLSPAVLLSLRGRILDCLDGEHGGALEGGKALREALRRQDLTRRSAGAPMFLVVVGARMYVTHRVGSVSKATGLLNLHDV